MALPEQNRTQTLSILSIYLSGLKCLPFPLPSLLSLPSSPAPLVLEAGGRLLLWLFPSPPVFVLVLLLGGDPPTCPVRPGRPAGLTQRNTQRKTH
ncbi:hypothetical protein C8Q69DRAFT_461969 [Paecilomyces variotii]|uniref:Uncharacterized protein n=1 Tax=Byssochlamys spectabilis TaxID=264951 RepID=A0A443HYR1_BYSSP|nr:hypothetical protein C8Q69DRAFT_461969 [Paecilomyces variotii]RWQ96988.1 hypothetical protein C8Q69DRAFT_461969 [Paecilomyces variotii]